MDRILIVMRHAKSDWPRGVADDQRPLGSRGRRDAPAAGRRLLEAGLVPDAAIVSPATRTRQTFELASAQWEAEVPVTFDAAVYGADWTELLDVVRRADPRCTRLLLVGHNPGCGELVAHLAGPDSDSEAVAGVEWKYPTSGVAVLRTDSAFAELMPGSATLTDFFIPRG